MASVDKKVVSMEFNNSGFESKIAATLSSLRKLSDSLKFSGSKEGFSDVQKAADGVNLGGMGNAVDGISGKFIALTTIAVTALANITSRAVDAGINLGKAFTIAPVTDGFAEFELKMGAIQTIMSGSGESLETVNEKLNELNEYSDRTIYSFADMTQNIGKFTNAGVSLEDSVAAIQGVANVAALSGSNAQQAANAMYNFSQALATGSVKLIDWKSIENAGLATVGFKEELLEGAVAVGTLRKVGDGLYETLDGKAVDSMKNFNSTLQEGWLDAETLTTTLGRYSDQSTELGQKAAAAAQDVKTFSQALDTIKEAAASGWVESFEIVVGDFEEGKALWTEFEAAISSVTGTSADMRNQVLGDWKALGGRTVLLDGIRDAVKGIATILAPIKEAFREIFPRKTGQDLFDLTKKFAAFAKSIAISGGTADKIKSIFKGFFSAIKIGIAVVTNVVGVFKNLFKLLVGGTGQGALSFFAKIGDGITKLKEALVDGKGIEDFFDGINESVSKFIKGLDFTPVVDGFNRVKDAVVGFVQRINLDPVIDAFRNLKDTIFGLFSKGGGGGSSGDPKEEAGLFTKILSGLGDAAKAVGKVLTAVWGVFKTLGSGIATVGGFIGDVVSTIAGGVGDLGGALGDGLGNITWDKVLDGLKVGLLGGVVALAGKMVLSISGLFKSGSGILDSISESIDGVTGVLGAMQKSILADALLKIAFAIGVLALSLFGLSFLDGGEIGKSLGAIAGGLTLMVGTMAALDKIAQSGSSGLKLMALSVSLALLAGAVILLAFAVKLLGGTDPLELAAGLGAMGLAIFALAKAVEPLSENSKGLFKAGFGIAAIGAGLVVVALAIKLMGMIDPLDLAQGLATMAVSLGLIVTAMQKLPAEASLMKAGAGIILMGIGFSILAGAIKLMGMLSLEELAKGLGGIGLALAGIAGAMRLMGSNDQILESGAAILLVSIGLTFMARAVKAMASISLPQMIKGIAGIAATMIVLAIALKSMEGKLKGAATLALVVYSLGKFADVLRALGNLSIGEIVKSFIILGVALGGLAIAVNLISPLIPILTAFGIAIALVGLGFAGFGAGAFLVARAIQILSVTGRAGVKVFMEVLDEMLLKLPAIATALGEAAYMFALSFLEGQDELIAAGVELIGGLLNAIRELFPDLIDTAVELIQKFLEGIREVFPDLVEAGLDILTTLLTGIRDNIQNVVTLVAEIVLEFITGLANAYQDFIAAGAQMIADMLQGVSDAAGDIVDAGADAIVSFLEGVADKVVDVVDAGFKIVIDMLNGLADSIRQNRGDLAAAGWNILTAVFGGVTDKFVEVGQWFTDLPGVILEKIGDVLNNIAIIQKGKDVIQGIWNGAKTVFDTVKLWLGRLGGSIKYAIGNLGSLLYDVGKAIIQGLWNGMKWLWDNGPVGWIRGLGGWIQRNKGPMSYDKVMLFKNGSAIMQGLYTGMKEGWRDGEGFVRGLGPSIVDGFQVNEKELTNPIRNAVTELSKTLGDLEGMNASPVITPVLDLTKVKQDGKYLTGLFSYGQATQISMAANANQMQELNAQNGVTEIKFEQVNNSPKALSTNDIYRQTRSQIALAKEELSIA